MNLRHKLEKKIEVLRLVKRATINPELLSDINIRLNYVKDYYRARYGTHTHSIGATDYQTIRRLKDFRATHGGETIT